MTSKFCLAQLGQAIKLIPFFLNLKKKIPINPEVGKTGDEGKPIVEASPEHEISQIYLNFAEKIKLSYL